MKIVNEVEILLPKPPLKKDNRYQRDKKRKQCRQRAVIEPLIGHLKQHYRLSRNFLKGTLGDEINVLMSACAWNIKKWINGYLAGIFCSFYSIKSSVFIAYNALRALTWLLCFRVRVL